MDISVVIPLYNEEILPELHDWIRRVMEEQGFSYEIIFVDDGSTDASWQVISQLRKESDKVKAISSDATTASRLPSLCLRKRWGRW